MSASHFKQGLGFAGKLIWFRNVNESQQTKNWNWLVHQHFLEKLKVIHSFFLFSVSLFVFMCRYMNWFILKNGCIHTLTCLLPSLSPNPTCTCCTIPRWFSGVWACNEVREWHKDWETNLSGAPDQGSGVQRGPVKQTWRHRGREGLRVSCDLIKLCYFAG